MQEPTKEPKTKSSLIIEIKNLDFHYDRAQVLNQVNAKFVGNHISAIIGPSGCGKSTLLRCMNRIYALYPKMYAQGEILFHGSNILSSLVDVHNLRRQIGMVFQKPTPFPMSIYDNIAFALRLHYKIKNSELDDRIELALKQAALWDEVKDKLHNAGTHLSGGQQQRLCIARAIAIQPEVLLLDEPTSALDPIATSKVEELIITLKEKYHIIMVTHNLKQAKRISDETFFMQNGRIVETGPTDVFFSSPKNDEARSYIEDY